MVHAHKDLGLSRLWVVYPGEKSYALEKWASVLPLPEVIARGERIFTARA
jgi:hypothetical protein